jgi:hypothetical protein
MRYQHVLEHGRSAVLGSESYAIESVAYQTDKYMYTIRFNDDGTQTQMDYSPVDIIKSYL